MKKNYWTYLIPVILIVALDQALKLWVHANMQLGDEIKIFGEWFRLHYVLNPGIAYGIQMDFAFGKPLLSLVRVLAVAGLTWFLIKAIQKKAHKGLLWVMVFILGGAAGNMIDSVFYGVFMEGNAIFSAPTPWLHGQVIDMLYFPMIHGTFPEWFPVWGGEAFTFFNPIFNIADAAISVGFVTLLLGYKRFFPEDDDDLFNFFSKKKDKTAEQKEDEDSASSTVNFAVILFDGVCNLCNSSVDFIIRRDKKRFFRFAANQSEAGQALLQKHSLEPQDVDTLYLIEGEKVYDRSTAVLRIGLGLGFPWNLSSIFLIIPAFLRDPLYKIIARNRYRMFGKKDSCRLPTAEEAALFL